MRDDFGGLIAASPASLRRDPTPAEVAGGLACGAAGKEFWNEILFAEASILGELNTILDAAGIAPDETQTAQVLAALLKIIPGQSKSLFNSAPLVTNTRTVMSYAGGSAGVLVPAISPLSYTKKSNTSVLLVLVGYQTYSNFNLGSGNGPITARLTIGLQSDERGTTNGFNISGTPVQLSAGPMFRITGVPAGAQPVNFGFLRNDTLAWGPTTFNPTGSDAGGFPTPNIASFWIFEVEPS